MSKTLEDYKEMLNNVIEKARERKESLSATDKIMDLILEGIKIRGSRTLGQVLERKEVVGTCTVCAGGCCKMGNANGYFSQTDIHDDVILGKVDLTSFMIPGDNLSRRCSFLSPTGCNIPRDYRSHTCVTYLCGKLSTKLGGTAQNRYQDHDAKAPRKVLDNVHFARLYAPKGN